MSTSRTASDSRLRWEMCHVFAPFSGRLDRSTVGEMTYLQSHQGKIEIFEFSKNSFPMALATSWSILKCIFQTLGPSDKRAVDAFYKHFWHAQNNRKSSSWKHLFGKHDFENPKKILWKNGINNTDWTCSELPLDQSWWNLVNGYDQETTSLLLGCIWVFCKNHASQK